MFIHCEDHLVSKPYVRVSPHTAFPIYPEGYFSTFCTFFTSTYVCCLPLYLCYYFTFGKQQPLCYVVVYLFVTT